MKPEKFHDVMNSLGVIKNMADLLLEEEIEPVKRDMLLRIKTRSERITDLVSIR